jgi:hypothetical protein
MIIIIKNYEALDYVTSSLFGSNKPLTITKQNCSSVAFMFYFELYI